MKVRFKEDRRAWRRFALEFAVAPLVVGGLLWWKDVLGPRGFAGLVAGLALFELSVFLFPRWNRAFYRGALTVSARVGHFMGQFLLTLLFFLLLTPVGLALRLAGKDLLQLRRDPRRSSYWQPARRGGGFERMF